MTGQTWSIRIFDNKHQKIGELMDATQADILKFITKGFIVVDIETGETMNPAPDVSTLGVSDGCIDI